MAQKKSNLITQIQQLLSSKDKHTNLESIQNYVGQLSINNNNYFKYRNIILQFLELKQFDKYRNIGNKVVDYLINIEWFHKNFKKDKSIIAKYLPDFKIKRVKKQEIIVTKGSPSTEFYILFQGEIVVVKQIYAEDKNLAKQEFSKLPTDKRFQHEQTYYQYGNRIIEGDHFGDIGIIYKKNRMATLVATIDCILIQMSSDVFNRLSAESSCRAHQIRFQFLCDKFSNKIARYCYEEQQQLLLAFETKVFSFGSCIQKSSSQYYYLIEEGSVTSFTSTKRSKTMQRTEFLSSGMFIGIGQLISQLKRNLNHDTQSESEIRYQSYAESEIVKTYQINKKNLVKFILNHKDLLKEILEKQEYRKRVEMIEQRVKFQRDLRNQMSISQTQEKQCFNVTSYKKIRKLLTNSQTCFKIRKSPNVVN